MTEPVYFVEFNSPDPDGTSEFFRAVFDWDPQPFASPDYLVAPHGEVAGVDSAILPSRDRQPRTVPVIRVADLATAMKAVESHGGAVVVPPFTMGGLGSGCYITDPAGILVGLHAYAPPE
jgi:predicted enzyme related to lactoylglutathione lyase